MRPAARPARARRPAPGDVRASRGTVVRVSVESDDGTPAAADREVAIATWLQTPTRPAYGADVDACRGADGQHGRRPGRDGRRRRPSGAGHARDAAAAAESGASVVAATVTPPADGTRARGRRARRHRGARAAARAPTPDATTPSAAAAAVDGPVSPFWSAQTGGRVRFRVVRVRGLAARAQPCDDAWGLWAEAAARWASCPGRAGTCSCSVPATVAGCYAGLGTIGATSDAGGVRLRARHPDRAGRPRARAQPRARALQRPAVRRDRRRHLDRRAGRRAASGPATATGTTSWASAGTSSAR